MFKDILVPIVGCRGDTSALDVGASLAEGEGARLTVLQMVYLPTSFSSNWRLARDAARGDIYRTLIAEGEAHATRHRSRLQSESFHSTVKVVETTLPDASQVVAEHAYRTDLTVVAGATGDNHDSGTLHVFLAELFLASGGPVMVVPPRSAVSVPMRRIVVAWRPTREAKRALNDAMPFLIKADAVDIVVVDPAGGMSGSAAQQGADVAEYLSLHGVKANLIVREAGRQSTSSIVLDHARQAHADLLVAGGYGHSRLRESVLGGVTRELLISAPIPVLYSH